MRFEMWHSDGLGSSEHCARPRRTAQSRCVGVAGGSFVLPRVLAAKVSDGRVYESYLHSRLAVLEALSSVQSELESEVELLKKAMWRTAAPQRTKRKLPPLALLACRAYAVCHTACGRQARGRKRH